MTGKKKKRGITPWKKTALKVCVLLLIAAGAVHGFREVRVLGFEDQREAFRWSSSESCAQVSAFLPTEEALMEENIQELEYKINTTLAQDSIKKTSEGKDSKLWQDCYSGIGKLTIAVGSKTVTVEAVGTGGAFFTFHPLKLSGGSYYRSDSLMQDEILLDQETAWKLFGSFDVEGRTVRVQDMHLRIAGVYKKGEGSLYKEGGLSDYVVFVQYKTLLQYGGNAGGSGNDWMTEPATATSPAGSAALLKASEGPADLTEEAVQAADPASEGNGSSAADSSQQSGAAAGSGAADSGTADSGTTGSGNADAYSGTQQEGSAPGSGDNSQNMDNVGTSNTNYRDTGMITTYEIVMPNPVDGYAAAAVKKAFGDDSGVIVVDNTNRYEIPNLAKDLKNFAFWGMRNRAVRYPYWENVAMGWETIFAALFLLECILIGAAVLLLIWMIIHWYRHKGWTLAGSVQNMQDSIYERQSRKKYPEYYKEKEKELSEKERLTADGQKENSMLEDKGLTPFETIKENRKAVQYETKHREDDQSAHGSSVDSDHDGLREGQQ